jgi:hypothetical protein
MKDRGSYLAVDSKGLPVVYERLDRVTFNGSLFVARVRNTYLDGTPTNSTIWQRQTSSLSHSSGDNPPSSPGIGDEWYDTTAGVLFKYISDGNSEQWVEIS